MSVESNINLYYEELISSIAERAKKNIADGGYEDETDAIWRAIDAGLIYCRDQAYILAMAACRGYVSWNEDINWEEITEMLFEDINGQLNEENK